MRINMTGTRTKVLAGGVGLALATVVLVATHAVQAAEAQRGGGRGAWMGGPRGAGPAGAFLPPLRRLELTDEQREQVRTAIVGIPVKWNSVSGDLEHGFRRSGTLVGA